ncbi:MAG: hypothetical protein WD425_01470 [Nitrospirales bacterium]
MDNSELYKIAVETRNLEIGLFWQRSNYFLVLNTAIAVGFFSVQDWAYQLALSIFGTLTSILWFCVNLGSKYWQSRWEHRASELERKLGENIEMFSASKKVINSDVKAALLNHKEIKELSMYDRWVMSKPSVSKIMSNLSALFIAFWLVVFILALTGRTQSPDSSPDSLVLTSNLLNFTPCGLIFDACGVLLLGFAFFLKTTESMIQESGTTWDSKAYVHVVSGKCDGVFGTLLLFLGFLYQTLGYAGVTSTNAILASYATLIVFLVAYVVFLRNWLINKWVEDIKERFSEK